nr:retrovirus-related Pol polyprotein from transposon TNT 1-94 [Tanacetum cinerariifolium]
MGDEHLDIILATESDEVIKSSIKDLVPIPSEFEGIPDTMCDVHLDNNHTALEAKDHVEIIINSNDDISSSDDDSLHEENIEYVEASPHDSELVSLEAAEIVILEDETSGIHKSFITGIENQLNHRIKIIRCDNGTEFKNSEMNQFYQMKRIKREFSVARTPQQNVVAKRNNRTLIEAARTMLTDSLLPTIFWAEAVNTACYVQNRVLVIKPQNKIPYELLIGRSPNIDFMKPFGCPVTILNTLDHLGKFEGKANEGFLVGYSINFKAFRVFNSRTRKVEENLHIKFLENKSNVSGRGPEWIFDINSQTKFMNYEPVTARNQTNDDADDKDDDEVPGKGDEGVSKGSEIDNQERTNSETGIFDDVYDDREVGVEADINNLELSIVVSPIPITRVHKDHPKEQIKPTSGIAINVESLATKYPIVDLKTHILTENMMYYQIIRANGSSKNYKILTEMCDDFDRLDIIDLYMLVKERYETTSPEGYDLLLWGDLITLFEPSKEDVIWKAHRDYKLIT